MQYKEALNKLYSMHQFSVKLGLDNIRNFLTYLGNPEKELKAFHVAGSNGKGSTASFMASILSEAGYKTGLYTSPHFVKFNERVKINGVMIPDDFIADFISRYNDYIDKYTPTFFEITTALAFIYFKEMNVDYCVIETGLGGRLDATNVIDPVASIITTIFLEHTHILGNSFKEIAFEKGGIIKNNTPVFTGILNHDAEEEITKICKERIAPIFSLNDSVNFYSDSSSLNYNKQTLTLYTTPLAGKYQLNNSLLAVYALLRTIGIEEKHLIAGINNVKTNTGIEGRYEIYNEEPQVIFDASHNPDGIKVFMEEFKKERNNYDNTSVIFGVMKDKNILDMMESMKGEFDNYYCSTIEFERAAGIDDIINIGKELEIEFKGIEEPSVFIKNFIKSENKSSCLIVLGSIYLVGAIKEKLHSKKA